MSIITRRSVLRTGLAAVAAVTAVALSACSSLNAGSTTSTAKKDHYTFELITLSNASPYWLAVKAGAEKAATAAGNVTIKYDAPANDGDVADQITIFNSAVTSHVDGILIAAGNPEALVQPIKNAQAAGIPVITVDQGVNQNAADAFVATDNVAAGKKVADYMTSLLPATGSYAIVNPSLAFTSGQQRPQGFQQGMAAKPGISFVGMQQSESDIATAQNQAANFIQANPGLSMIFAANDRSATGVGNAISSAGAAGKVLGAAFDVNPDILKDMRGNVFQAALLQSPSSEGEIGVQTMLKKLQGGTVDQVIPTPTFLLTTKNIDTPEAISAIQQYIPTYTGSGS